LFLFKKEKENNKLVGEIVVHL